MGIQSAGTPPPDAPQARSSYPGALKEANSTKNGQKPSDTTGFHNFL